MTPDEKRLEEIEVRAKSATPGPWSSTDGTVWQHPNIGHQIIARCWRDLHAFWGSSQEISDAHFIAHAREDIPWLIAKVRELEEELQIYRNSETVFTGNPPR